MAKAHVPKFGNWENAGDVPYTQYFDNARKGKIAGKLINPNDPEENPESFNNDYVVTAPPTKRSSASDDLKRRDVDICVPPGSPLRHDAAARKPADPHRRPNRMSAGSDRSFEQSPLRPNYQAKSGGRVGVNSPSWEKRGSLEGHGLAPNTPGRYRGRAGGRSNEMSEKGSAVPKFGEWDASNPASADGFTHIFNRVREEKQVGSARVPTMSKESSYRNSHDPDSGYQPSKCGCFGWLKN